MKWASVLQNTPVIKASVERIWGNDMTSWAWVPDFGVGPGTFLGPSWIYLCAVWCHLQFPHSPRTLRGLGFIFLAENFSFSKNINLRRPEHHARVNVDIIFSNWPFTLSFKSPNQNPKHKQEGFRQVLFLLECYRSLQPHLLYVLFIHASAVCLPPLWHNASKLVLRMFSSKWQEQSRNSSSQGHVNKLCWI